MPKAKKEVAKKATKKVVKKAPVAKAPKVEKVIEVVKERLHEGVIVDRSEDVVMEGHAMERLFLRNGCQTIIPKE